MLKRSVSLQLFFSGIVINIRNLDPQHKKTGFVRRVITE